MRIETTASIGSTDNYRAAMTDAAAVQSFDMAVQGAVGTKVLDGNGQQGTVVVAFSLSMAGDLLGARVLRSSGSSRLDETALARVMDATYPMPTHTGARLSHVTRITFR